MRWQDLFGDLERQWDALAEADRQAEIAERTRAEFARVTLADRLRGSEGRAVVLVVRSGQDVTGEIVRVGSDFLLLATPRQEYVVPLAAIASLRGLGPAALSADAAGPVRARLGLGSVLRRIAADRSTVALVRDHGPGLTGTLQRVGADFVELREHAVDEAPRSAAGQHALVVPFAAISMLRREGPTGAG